MLNLKSRVLLIVLSLLFVACVVTSLLMPLLSASAASSSDGSNITYSIMPLSDFYDFQQYPMSTIYYNFSNYLSDFSYDASLLADLITNDFPAGTSAGLRPLLYFYGFLQTTRGLANVIGDFVLSYSSRPSLYFRLWYFTSASSTPTTLTINLVGSASSFPLSVLGYNYSRTSAMLRPLVNCSSDVLDDFCGFPFFVYYSSSSDVGRNYPAFFTSCLNWQRASFYSTYKTMIDTISAQQTDLGYYWHNSASHSQALTILSRYFSFGKKITSSGSDASYEAGYLTGYQNGTIQANNAVTPGSASYFSGYNEGINYATTTVLEDSASYSAGYTKANNTVTTTSSSYTAGYNKGVTESSNYSFLSLIGAVFDAPVNAFMDFFNFEVLGVNLTGLLSALFVLAIVITILRLVLGG